MVLAVIYSMAFLVSKGRSRRVRRACRWKISSWQRYVLEMPRLERRCFGAQIGAPNRRLLLTSAAYKLILVQGMFHPCVPMYSHIFAKAPWERYFTLCIMVELFALVLICIPKYLNVVIVLKLYCAN